MATVNPLDYESPEDFTCRKRWPVNAAWILLLIGGFVLLFTFPLEEVDCDPSTDDGSCSDDTLTKEVVNPVVAIVALILLVTSVTMCKVSYWCLYKNDKKEYKEAKIQAELAKREGMTTAQQVAIEAAMGGGTVGMEAAFDGGAVGITVAAVSGVMGIGVALSKKEKEIQSLSKNSSATQSRSAPKGTSVVEHTAITKKSHDKTTNKQKKFVGLEGEMARLYAISFTDAQNYLYIANKQNPFADRDTLLDAARAIMEREKEDEESV